MTDPRRTDGQTELRRLRRATAVAAVGRKNTESTNVILWRKSIFRYQYRYRVAKTFFPCSACMRADTCTCASGLNLYPVYTIKNIKQMCWIYTCTTCAFRVASSYKHPITVHVQPRRRRSAPKVLVSNITKNNRTVKVSTSILRTKSIGHTYASTLTLSLTVLVAILTILAGSNVFFANTRHWVSFFVTIFREKLYKIVNNVYQKR